MKRADLVDREARLNEAYERAERGDDGGIDILLDELKTTSTEEEQLRATAATLLDQLGENAAWIEPRAEAVLLAAAKAASTSDLAYAAIRALGYHGGPTAIPALLEVISFPSLWNAHATRWRDRGPIVDVAEQSIEWIIDRHREEGLQCLLEHLRNSHRFAAAQLLGEHGDERARPVLEGIANDERADPPFRAAARKALVEIRLRSREGATEDVEAP
jgi:HEAT repeat protein